MGMRNVNKIGQISVIARKAYIVKDVDPTTGEITLDPISDDFQLDRNSINNQIVDPLTDFASKIGIIESLADRTSFEAAVVAYLGDR